MSCQRPPGHLPPLQGSRRWAAERHRCHGKRRGLGRRYEGSEEISGRKGLGRWGYAEIKEGSEEFESGEVGAC